MPRTDVHVVSGDPGRHAGEPERVDLNTLPQNLFDLDADELESANVVRDERVTTLFRRWPKLSQLEIRELKRLYGERLRLARHLGRRRCRDRPEPPSERV